MKRRWILLVPILALICTFVYWAAVSLNQTTEPSSTASEQINEQGLPEDLDQAIQWLATQEPVVAPQMKFERSSLSVGREPREVRHRDLIMVTCDGVRHQMAPRDFGPWAEQMRDSRVKRLRIVMPYNPFGQQIIELWRLANWEQLWELDLAMFYGYNGRQLASDAWRSLPGLDLPQISSQWIGGSLNFAPMTNVEQVHLYNSTETEIHAIAPVNRGLSGSEPSPAQITFAATDPRNGRYLRGEYDCLELNGWSLESRADSRVARTAVNSSGGIGGIIGSG